MCAPAHHSFTSHWPSEQASHISRVTQQHCCCCCCIRGGRGPEGGAALRTALRFGLDDANLLEELAQGFAELGCAAETRTAMEAAVAVHSAAGRGVIPLRLALTQLLLECGDVGGARGVLEGAAARAQGEQEVGAVHALIPRLIDMQLRGQKQ